MDTIVKAELTIADLPEDTAWPRYELLDGGLHVTPSANLHHQRLVGRLVSVLGRLAPGDVAVLPGANVIVGNKTLLIPDVVVADAHAVEAGGLGLDPRDVVWVIEVLSPSTARVDRTLKKETYSEWGIPTYWVVDPAEASIDRHGSVPTPAWVESLDEGVLFD